VAVVDLVEEVPVEVGNVPEWAANYISQEQALAVSKVIQKEESNSSAEIVTVVARSCSPSGHLPRIVFIILLLLETIFIVSWIQLVGWLTLPKIITVVAGGLVFVAWLTLRFSRADWVVRLLSHTKDIERLVWERAELEFYRHKMDQTHKKSGALIFISLQEKRAVLLTDPQVDAKLPDGLVKSCVDDMTRGAAEGQLSAGIIDAIERLTPEFIQRWPKSSTDSDELSNHVRFVT
jgi:putative membrane protein